MSFYHTDLAGLTDFLYLRSTNYACQREFGHYHLTWTPNLFWQRLKDKLFRIFCQQYGISNFHAIEKGHHIFHSDDMFYCNWYMIIIVLMIDSNKDPTIFQKRPYKKLGKKIMKNVMFLKGCLDL